MSAKSRTGITRVAAVGVAIAIVVLAALVAATRPAAVDANSNKISTEVLEATTGGQETSFIVYMQEQADLSAAAAMTDQDARGWYVYNTLKAAAATSQAPVRAELEAEGVSYKPYWAVNMIVVEGDRGLVDDLAARTDVKAIESNAVVSGIEGEDAPESTDEGNAVEAVEPGLTSTQAPTFWTSTGFNGQGIVVANQDTGMRWTHSALRNHYRGWISGTTADNNYNWHDSIHARITNADGGTASPATNSCGYNLVAPCDDQGHGTHTTGTTIGDDVGVGAGTNQIGVAPGAKWIGCRNMDAGNGRAATYTECFQFFLAPTNLSNTNADPTKRPHVMNNSWGCPTVGELCPRDVMKTIVENSEAAGIFISASAGNDGPNCGTVLDPPGIYESAFSTGALSTSNTAPALQSFSSRGAVTSDGSNRMKPDISAPGASVRSSLRTTDTSYGSMSGTSMASPHIVGTVALLWSGKPRLVRDVPRTKWLLTRSASRTGITVANNSTGCGGIVPTPNNHFGWGRVQIQAAYNLEPSLEQTITFPALADKTFGDGDFAPGASASSTLPVSYSASGNCSIVGGLVHITGGGSCTVTGSQAGLDAYSIAAGAPKPWYPAADVQRTFSIAKADQTIDFGALADRTWGDPDFDVAATATSGLPVSFSAAGGCTVTGSTVHVIDVGTCTVTASQGGNADWNAAPEVSRSFNVAWSFGGFRAPVDNPPVLNVAQAGSTIPVKFSLAGFQGLAVFASGYPKSAPVACATGAVGDPIEQTVAPGASTLTYDAVADQYHYNWKTDKAWASSCRQLQLKLRDNTVHTAAFQFKK